MLTDKQIQDYQSNGYLILDQLFSAEAMDTLKSRANQIVEDFDPNSNQSIFTTNDHGKTRDQYFLDSADKVSCFFEEEAFNSEGQLKQDKSLSINKIGHALHTLDPDFHQFSHQSLIKTIANDVGLSKPQIRQSMYIFKQPNIGGVVNWHQDATYFFTEPTTVTTFWFAIEDANLSNGCLRVQTGGHNTPLRERFICESNGSTYLKSLDNTPWPDDDTSIAVPVKKGSLVVFQGNLPHYSAPNLSTQSRHAYTLHITCGSSLYAKENWLQAPPSEL